MDPGGPKPDVAGTPLDGGRRSSDPGDDTSISDQRPSTPQLPSGPLSFLIPTSRPAPRNLDF